MATFSISTLAATAVVGYDLMSNSSYALKPYNRVISSVGCVGSTNPADAKFDLFVGETKVGDFFNTTGGANIVPNTDKDWIRQNIFVPANVQLRAVVSDAAATNPLVVTFQTVP